MNPGSRSPRSEAARRSVHREKGPLDLFLDPIHPIFRIKKVPEGTFFLCGGDLGPRSREIKKSSLEVGDFSD